MARLSVDNIAEIFIFRVLDPPQGWVVPFRGGVPEWLKGTGCKPVGYAYVGSNPTSSTIFVPNVGRIWGPVTRCRRV